MPDYRFGKLEDKLLRLCNANQPDYEKIQQRISEGANVNAISNNGENMLTAIYRNQVHGDKFPGITQLLLNAGFDAEKYGLNCISALVFSSYDKNIFLAAKLLLEAGADSDEKQWDSLLESIGTEESFQRCCENDHKCENIYYTFYEMVNNAHKKMPYNDINLWDCFIGQKVVTILSPNSNLEIIKPLRSGRYAIPDQLIFCSEDRTLIIEGNPNIYSRANPVPTVDMGKCIPVDELNCVLGSFVTDITFKHSEVSFGTMNYRQPNIYIKLDNGIRIRFSTDFGEVPKENTSTYFEIMR